LNVVLDNDYIESLKQVIFHLHKADSIWVESVPVREVSHGRVIWEGPVEVFTLRNHPRAKRAYAWCQPDGPKDERTRFAAVLEIPPVVSPETAVKVAITAAIKNKFPKHE
jgi:hypothetical protein